MTSVTLLSNWFRIHNPFPQKSKITSRIRTGYDGAYPKIQRIHRRQSNLFSCIPLNYKSNKKKSSIKGCASFARYDTYQEGDTEDGC
jgi:hypothetical protein